MTTADPAPVRSHRAPVTTERVRPRDLTPDLARGLGLLGIAVVNARLLAPHPVTSAADQVTTGVVTTLLENRSWPMLALMFGFGIAAIAAKLDRLGLSTKARQRVLSRRNWWLLAFGFAKCVLVFWGDILGVYGLTGVVVVALLRRSARTRVDVRYGQRRSVAAGHHRAQPGPHQQRRAGLGQLSHLHR